MGTPDGSAVALGRVGVMAGARTDVDSRSMRERMLAGDLYIADDPEIAEAASAAMELMDAYNAPSIRQGRLRRRLLESLLGSVGDGTEIRPPFYVDYGSHISIGARCLANVGLGGGAIVLPGASIGDNTVVGAGAVVTRDLPENVVAVGNPARVVRTT